MCAKQGLGGGPSGAALNRLAKELRDLQKKPEEGIRVRSKPHSVPIRADSKKSEHAFEKPDGTVN